MTEWLRLGRTSAGHLEVTLASEKLLHKKKNLFIKIYIFSCIIFEIIRYLSFLFFFFIADYVYFENSSSNPYLIRRIEELNKVRKHPRFLLSFQQLSVHFSKAEGDLNIPRGFSW